MKKLKIINLLKMLKKISHNLKEFQRRWTEIGFVPLKQKEEIQISYRKAIDKLFDSLKIDDGKKRIMKFKSRIEQMPHNA